MIVVDPSAILGLAMEDEVADYASRVLTAIEADGALVPALFWFEVRNVLVVNERRGRLTPQETNTFLASLSELSIEIAPVAPDLGVLDLARRHGLTVYDAAYLDLASRTGVPLATLDRQLRQAAGAAEVTIFLPEPP